MLFRSFKYTIIKLPKLWFTTSESYNWMCTSKNMWQQQEVSEHGDQRLTQKSNKMKSRTLVVALTHAIQSIFNEPSKYIPCLLCTTHAPCQETLTSTTWTLLRLKSTVIFMNCSVCCTRFLSLIETRQFNYWKQRLLSLLSAWVSSKYTTGLNCIKMSDLKSAL